MKGIYDVIRLHYYGVSKAEFPCEKGIVIKFAVENVRHFCVLPGELKPFTKAEGYRTWICL